MRISDWSSDVCYSDLMVKTIIANLTQTRDRGATVNNMNGHDSIVSIAINNYDCGTNRFSRKEGTTPFVSVACTVNLSEGEYTIELGLRSGTGLMRSEEHTSELQSLMRISYAVFCLKKKTKNNAP